MHTADLAPWLTLLAPDLVTLLLGPKWQTTGVILTWLAVTLVPQVLNSNTGWLYLARNDSKRMMQWGIIGWAVVIACMLGGLRWGPVGVAAMYSLSMVLILAPCLSFAFRGTGIVLMDIWRITWRPVLGATIATAMAASTLQYLHDAPVAVRVIAEGALIGALYLALQVTVLGQRRQILGLWTSLRTMARPAT